MNVAHPNLKQKAKHELWEMTWLFLYLAFFFCALVTYDTFLLDEYHVKYMNYAFAIINALVITKVIMIGEYAKVGKRYEERSLLVSAIWKSVMFGLLVFAFHLLEELIKRVIHGRDMATITKDMRFDQLVSRSIVVFCIFIPLFGFRELRRVMGEEEFRKLVFDRPPEGK